MKLGYLKIFALSTSLFVLSIAAIEYSIRAYFSDDSYFAQAVIAARGSLVHCAIFGDSHAAASFRNELAGCYNFSAGGMGLFQINQVIDSVNKSNALNKVIITFGPQLFSADRVHNTSTIFSSIGQEFTPLPNPLVIQPLMFDRWKIWFKDRLLTKPKNGPKQREQSWNSVSETSKNEAIGLRLLKQRPLPDYQMSSTLDKLAALIERLKMENVHVCLVRTPVSIQYAKALGNILDSDEWLGLLARLNETGATVIDYRQLSLGLKEDQFSNEDHLNPSGAKVFATAAYDLCFGR